MSTPRITSVGASDAAPSDAAPASASRNAATGHGGEASATGAGDQGASRPAASSRDGCADVNPWWEEWGSVIQQVKEELAKVEVAGSDAEAGAEAEAGSTDTAAEPSESPPAANRDRWGGSALAWLRPPPLPRASSMRARFRRMAPLELPAQVVRLQRRASISAHPPATAPPPHAPSRATMSLGERMWANLVEQLVPPDVFNALAAIYASRDPPQALVGYVVGTLRGPVADFARSNLRRVYATTGVGVSVCCLAFHSAKSLVKALTRRVPVCGRVVAFVSDVCLPTGFFGPFLTTFVVLRAVLDRDAQARSAAALSAASREAVRADGADGGATSAARPSGAAELASHPIRVRRAGGRPRCVRKR